MLGRAVEWAAQRAQAAARSFGRDRRDVPGDLASAAEPSDGSQPIAALPSMIWIRYQDEGGALAELTLTLREGWREGGALMLRAWLHARREAVVLEASRIRELLCLATGERAEDPTAWLERYALLSRTPDDDETHRAIAAARDELALLVYLGRADGAFDADEIEVATDHVIASSRRSVDRVRCAAYLRRLTPDPDDLAQVMARVMADDRRWERLRRSAHRLLLADGKVSADEQKVWADLERQGAAAGDPAAREAEFLGLVERSTLGQLLGAEEAAAESSQAKS